MICYRSSPGPVPHPTDPAPDSAAADRAARSLASKPITAIFPRPGLPPGHTARQASSDTGWALHLAAQRLRAHGYPSGPRDGGAGDGELNPHYQLGKSVALYRYDLLTP
jgi:hypothetical protein